MRVTIDITAKDGEHYLVVSGPDGPWPGQDPRPVTWLAGKLLVPRDAASTDGEPAELVRAVECCDTGGNQRRQQEQLTQLKQYGQLLFEAAFGDDLWQQILAAVAAAAADYLEIAVRATPDDDHVALQALRWEALFDGTRFVAAQGATYGARIIPVGVVRVIASASPIPGNGGPGGGAFAEITHIPKVLFAVGSHLTDRAVRSGAEFMGIMRRLDRDGGSIRARVLESATRLGLVGELGMFQPDVLHLIGHGRVGPNGQVEVQLRDESGRAHYASAEELLSTFGQADHWPAMVVLSACQTAAGGQIENQGRVSSLPFAARLVAGTSVSRGVPVVVAMAGDISDTACRVFTQSLTTAIGHGVPLAKAVIRGRRAAFYKGPGPTAQHPAPDSGHWVMPALFLADFVGGNARLVRADPAKAARQRARDLNLVNEPVFYGRAPFLTALDRLLDAADDLNVLVAYTPDPSRRYGSYRLLQELGARAVRSDVLPVMLGPFDRDGPQNLQELAAEIEKSINFIRTDLLDLDERASDTVAAVKAGASGGKLAAAIRKDLAALVEALPEDDPVRHRPPGQPRTVLLCHRVNAWGAVLDELPSLLGSHGLQGRTAPVPLVLAGADVRALKDLREGRPYGRPPWMDFLPLRRFYQDQDKDEDGRDVDPVLREEDVLAYQWWLLNPPRTHGGQQLAFAPKRGVPEDWKSMLRITLRHLDVMYDDRIYEYAAGLSCLVSASDDALLASYSQVFR